MSATGAANKPDLFSVIESDIKNAAGWVAAEAQGIGTTLWSIFKVAILSITSDQAQVVVNVLSRLNTDVVASKTIEQIETDLLNEALQDELAILQKVESATLQALIAAWKAS